MWPVIKNNKSVVPDVPSFYFICTFSHIVMCSIKCILLLLKDASWNTHWLSVMASHAFSDFKGLWFACNYVFNKQRILTKYCLFIITNGVDSTGLLILRPDVQNLEYCKCIIWCLFNDEHSKTGMYVTSQFVVLFVLEALPRVLLRFLI